VRDLVSQRAWVCPDLAPLARSELSERAGEALSEIPGLLRPELDPAALAVVPVGLVRHRCRGFRW